VWRQVDAAARSAEALWSEGRQVDFHHDADGRLRISLVDHGRRVRDLSILETLAIAAGAPV
jgi:hypothetical protein